MSGGDHEGEFEDAQLLHSPWLILADAKFSEFKLVQQQKFKIIKAVIG